MINYGPEGGPYISDCHGKDLLMDVPLCGRISSKTAQPMSLYLVPISYRNNEDVQHALHVDNVERSII